MTNSVYQTISIMNRQQRREYHRSFTLFMNKQEAFWLPKILKALQANNRAFAEYLLANGVNNALGAIDGIISIQPIMQVLNRMYVDLGLKRGRIVNQEIKHSANQKRAGLGFNEQLTKDIQRYFELYLLNKSVIPITNTQKELIRKVVAKGIEEGWGVEKMAREITNNPYTRKQARVVVRTETVRASNAGAELAAQRSEFVLDKEWISAMDDRVRRPPKSHFDHWDLDGQVVPYDRPFFSGGEELLFPGDPAGSAGNVIQCRCCVGYIPVYDSHGRPKRKPANYVPSMNAVFQPIPIEVPKVGVREVPGITIIQPGPSNITEIITIGVSELFK